MGDIIKGKDVELGVSSDIIKEGRLLYNRKTGKLFFDDLDKRVMINPILTGIQRMAEVRFYISLISAVNL